MSTRRVLPLVLLLASLAGMSTTAQQPPAPAPAANQRTPQEQRDIQTLVQLVNEVSAGRQAAPADIGIAWDSSHFVKSGDGSTYIPFTVTIDASRLAMPGAAVYVRVMSREQIAAAATPAPAAPAAPSGNNRNQAPAPAAPPRVVYAWENIYFTDIPATGKISRSVALRSGEYDVFVAVKEKSPVVEPAATSARPLQAGVLRHPLTVPDFNSADLTSSTVMIATAIEPVNTALTPQQQQENPYVFGSMRIVPSPDNKLKKSGELQVLFWVYGTGQAAGKPNVTIEYNFHQRTPEGEKYFNKTMPQVLNAETLPPQFDLTMGHQLPGSLVVPLTAFPVGDYRLEIIVTDKLSGKTLTQNVNFSVEA